MAEQNDPWSAFEIDEESIDAARQDPWSAFEAEQIPTDDVRRQTEEYREQTFTRDSALFGPMPTTERSGQEYRQKQELRAREINEFLGQEGGVYDPSDAFFDNPEDFLNMMDVARNRDFGDQRRKFNKKYPEGDIRRVRTRSGETVTLARKNPDSPYKELGALPQFVGGQGLASEQMMGGIAGTLATRGISGPAIGTGLGEIIQRYVERERGAEDLTASEIWTQGVREGGVAGAVDVATRGALRGLGLSTKVIEDRQAVEQSARLVDQLRGEGVEAEYLAEGQLGSPLFRGWFRQVGQTGSKGTVENKVNRQKKTLYNAFKNSSEEIPPGILSDTALRSIAEQQQRQIDNILTPRRISTAEAGEALREGMESWRKISREARDRMYNDAFDLADDVSFDISNVQSVANDIETPVVGRGRRGENVPVSERPKQEMQEILDTIDSLDPNISTLSAQGRDITGFEQIKTLRTRLFNLKQSDDPSVRRDATRLWSSLTESMDNPIGGNAQFRARYLDASEANKFRENKLEQLYIGRILNDRTLDAPEALAIRYKNPGHGTELRTLRNLMFDEDWQKFKNGVLTTFSDPEVAPNEALNRLQRWRSQDPDGLRQIMNEREEETLINYLNGRAQLDNDPIKSLIRRRMTDGERAFALARRSTNAELQDIISSSPNPEAMRESLKAGVYKNILDAASTTDNYGRTVMAPQTLLREVDRWKQSGKLENLLNAEDWQRIEDISSYASIVGEAGDIGGPMAAGAIRSGATEAGSQILQGKTGRVWRSVVQPVLTSDIIATWLSRDATAKLLRPVSQNTERLLRRIAIASELTARNMGVEELEEEPEEEL